MTQPTTLNLPRRADELLPLVYEELRRLAAAKMAREIPGQTLQATALVHEAYVRLSKNREQRWENRGHFFASAAEAMRRILVEQARKKAALRRGENKPKEYFEEMDHAAPEAEERVLAVDEVLEELAAVDSTQAEIVKLRFFVGLKHEEIAGLLELSEKTVRRQWNLAKIWMYRRISEKK